MSLQRWGASHKKAGYKLDSHHFGIRCISRKHYPLRDEVFKLIYRNDIQRLYVSAHWRCLVRWWREQKLFACMSRVMKSDENGGYGVICFSHLYYSLNNDGLSTHSKPVTFFTSSHRLSYRRICPSRRSVICSGQSLLPLIWIPLHPQRVFSVVHPIQPYRESALKPHIEKACQEQEGASIDSAPRYGIKNMWIKYLVVYGLFHYIVKGGTLKSRQNGSTKHRTDHW